MITSTLLQQMNKIAVFLTFQSYDFLNPYISPAYQNLTNSYSPLADAPSEVPLYVQPAQTISTVMDANGDPTLQVIDKEEEHSLHEPSNVPPDRVAIEPVS